MSIARSTVFGLALAAATWVAPAVGQDWSGNTPVFRSDVERQEREREAQRATLQKNYNVVYPKFMEGGERPDIKPEKPPIAYLPKNEPVGSVIVDTGGRKLYYVLPPGNQAYAYPISVGRDGFQWTGTERISRIASWPSWTPPPEMRQRQPGLPITVSGGVLNPLGAKALYLGNSIYRIHGTNNERSIGRASSSGCFRMMNEHVTHLATLAGVGTVVRVVSNYPGVTDGPALAGLLSAFSFGDDPPPAPPAKKQVPKKKSN